MIVKTKFLTVRSTELAAVGKNDAGGMYLVFKSGAQHHLKYDNQKELEADFKKIDGAMSKDFTGVELVATAKDGK